MSSGWSSFYLGEAPLLRSVPSYDLADEADRRAAMERLDELVIKPRDGFGGNGVTIMPRATEPQRRRTVGLLRRRPERFIAQETVELSSHPTVCAAGLQPRRVDLRPFVLSSRDGATAMPGGLTRYARGVRRDGRQQLAAAVAARTPGCSTEDR